MFLISGWLIGTRRSWVSLIWYAGKPERSCTCVDDWWEKSKFLVYGAGFPCSNRGDGGVNVLILRFSVISISQVSSNFKLATLSLIREWYPRTVLVFNRAIYYVIGISRTAFIFNSFLVSFHFDIGSASAYIRHSDVVVRTHNCRIKDKKIS